MSAWESPWAVARQAAEHAKDARNVATRAHQGSARPVQRALALEDAAAAIVHKGMQVAELLGEFDQFARLPEVDEAAINACRSFVEAARVDMQRQFETLRGSMRQALREALREALK